MTTSKSFTIFNWTDDEKKSYIQGYDIGFDDGSWNC
jgi:hypothetical protein